MVRNRTEAIMGRNSLVVNATNLGQFLDGIGVYTLNILRQLSRLRTHTHFIIYVNRIAKAHLKDITFPSNCDVRWVSGRISPDHRFKGHLLRLLFSNYLALRHFRTPVFAMSQLEAMFFKKKQVITIHDVIPLLFKRCHEKQYYYYAYLLGFALRRAQRVITPSHHTKGLLQENFGLSDDRVCVIYHGSTGQCRGSAAASLDVRGPFILFSGRIARMKNITGVLKAFARIGDRIPHRLVITGYGRKRMTAQFDAARLAKYGINPERVVFKGHVEQEEMNALLQKASLLVFPSFYEGFGLPPLEAMAVGCPTVVSNVASIPEVCADASYYVDPYSVDSIAMGIYSVLTDVALRHQLIERGLKRARQFSWDDSGEEHMKVFRHLVDEHVLAGADVPAASWRSSEIRLSQQIFGDLAPLPRNTQ
jgi:glycosyltransferase involved in cell wall biosynthesis